MLQVDDPLVGIVDGNCLAPNSVCTLSETRRSFPRSHVDMDISLMISRA
jgi:hypothetical protein